MAFQILTLSLAIACAFEFLRRIGVPLPVILVGYVITILSPQTLHMAAAVVKDTPYAAVCLTIAVLLGTCAADSTPRNRTFWVSLGLLLALLTLMRHNGILVSVGVALAIPVFLRHAGRWAFVPLFVSAIALLVITQVAYRVLEIRPRNFSHSATSYAWHVASMIDQDVPLSKEEAEYLGTIRALNQDRWMYTPTSVAVTIWGAQPETYFYFQVADSTIDRFREVHHSLILRYPGLFLRHLLRANAYLYNPAPPPPIDATVDLEFFLPESTDHKIRLLKEGIPITPVFEGINDWVSEAALSSLEGRSRWFFWMPAHFMYLGIIGVLVAAWRRRDWRWLLILLPVLLNTASLALGVAQETRFQFPVFLSFGFLAALAAVPKVKEVQVASAVPLKEAEEVPAGALSAG